MLKLSGHHVSAWGKKKRVRDPVLHSYFMLLREGYDDVKVQLALVHFNF